jgi:serine/threonine protein phosphatase 1
MPLYRETRAVHGTITRVRWVIGDIHGMLRPLLALLEAVHKADPTPALLFVGDFVNRGPDSSGVVDLLLTMKDARFCRGNHDDVFDIVLHNRSSTGPADAVPVFAWFMNHGLDRTLESYGADYAMMEQVARRPSPARIKELVDAVPDAHRAFFRNLPMSIEEPDLFIVHAKWDAADKDDLPDIATRLRTDHRLHHRVLWERFDDVEIAENKAWKRRGFFGHTPVINYGKPDLHAPVVGKQMVLLDTGVALSPLGRLTAWCAETDQYIQVDHFARPVPSK